MRTFKYFILFLCTLLTSHLVWADNVPDSSQVKVEAWDEGQVHFRCPAPETIEAYRSNPDFQYTIAQKKPNWFTRIIRWFFSKLSLDGTGPNVFLWILILLAVGSIIAIIIHLAGIPIKGLFMFSRSTKVAQMSFNLDNADINNQELPRLLDRYIKSEAYREATRILFLLVLRGLDQNKLINWQKWKTDREYYYELKQDHLKPDFKDLIRRYEYIWFGQFPIEKEEFELVHANYEQFISNIQSTKK